MNNFSKELLTVGEMASGVSLTIPVYRLAGSGKGPSVYIQANIHGAEVQGNAVIYQLLELLQKETLAGDITLVPYANPIGCNHKNGEYTLGRFDPITGVNWNRMYHFEQSIIEPFAKEFADADIEVIKSAFKQKMLSDIQDKLNHNNYGLTTGRRIAYQLQEMAHQADIVLDLHTGPVSSKHLYCPEYAKDSANYFNIAHTIFIPNGFAGAMDEATFCPWWYLTDAFAKQGRELNFDKESFTVELGSQELIDLDEALIDAQSILSYLQYKNVLSSNNYQPEKMTRYACYLKDYKQYYSPMGGMVDYLAEFGKPLAKGEPLARILRMDNYGDGDALHYLTLEEDVLPILHFASASVHQGTELYKLFTNYFTISN
ncbi:succinylglutamate desuccinylase/aspartoacylase family protein [Thalassomonas sp. M1454]|uniref:succinylglutamate desuccinylase/aspartoacylase family protein n=1 Tax=Thalassomonas sp. M1454 TaxID=2594477 RepID=UPI0011808048|nr:succinylglutamate desuccinylase/aspartoacylase family protein [Thalassomonas sp. M1454]TRX55879.1 succinylglutamate desuccinylase/aspartoacylase family protein [Thalassomonas sp. M1454]